ncbi:porin family protein [Rhodobacter sp. SY28-1]|uniref:porin family protein n=1 Tax=Rhodobacter sp. SY28-1 TaxID=2562317 RepID=UPI0010BF6E49|nr:porin family protein [Rhodobacter sp. SY28-1]
MKNTIVAVALALSGSAASAQDWSGPYIGASLGQGSGEVGVVTTSGLDTLDSGTVYGLFAGYNLQRNNMVYGAELAFQSGDIKSAAFPTQGIDRLMDLKGRFGYAAGPSLVYGVLGYSTNRAFVPGATSDGSGYSFGIGYDYKINDAFTIGGELLSRKMQNDETADIFELEPDISTFSLRAGMKF